MLDYPNKCAKKVFQNKIPPIPFHYSWIIVLITFLALLAAAGIRSTPGALIIPWENYFGWDRTEITFALATNLFLYGFFAPLAAALMELYGSRLLMTLALLLLAAGTGLSTLMNAPWQMNLLWGIVIGIGTGFLSPVVGTVIANRWFVKHQGVVIGIFSAAGAAGQLIFLPLFSLLLEAYDWQIGVMVISALIMAIILIVIVFMRDRPADIGLSPYDASERDDTASIASENPFALIWSGLKTAAWSKEFWLLSSSFFVCGATSNGLIATHFIPACIDNGISAITAAGLLSIAGFFNILGTTISGWLSDRFNNRWLLFWYYFLRGVSLLLLPFLLGSNFWSLSFFIIFYGLDWIATVPPTVRLCRDIFGSQGGIIFGWMMVLHQLGAALAAFGGGTLHTILGNYQATFLSAGLLCFIASGLFIKTPGKSFFMRFVA